MTMSSSFVFKVPVVLDFDSVLDGHEDKKKIEAYFDYDHENPESFNDDFEEDYDMFYLPNATDSGVVCNDNGRGKMRKSLSMSSLPTDNTKGMNKLCSQMEKTNLYSSNKNLSKNGHMLGSTASLDRRSTSKDMLLTGKKVYRSMAEEINDFHRRTPDRFHSKPKGSQPQLLTVVKPCPTIPQSPAFCKIRKRPVTALPYEERERMEFEEAQKRHVKARPANKKILEAKQQIKVVPKKPPTEIQAFKLTECQKPKVVVVPEQRREEFHAKPVPKAVYYPKLLPKKRIQVTESLTPNFVRKYNQKVKEAQTNLEKEKEKVDRGKENKPDNVKPTVTRPVPFSFEKRDQCHMKKREELVRKVLEQEKKNTEFHANPMPKLYKRGVKGSLESVRSSGSTKSEEQNTLLVEFKARPAKVLNKEPFIPKKVDRPHIEFDEFNLATTRRAREREEFENKKRERDEYMEQLRKQKEEEDRIREEEEIARLRKQIEHVAQPIRHYKELPKVEPKPLTSPCTPKFATDRLRRMKVRSGDITP